MAAMAFDKCEGLGNDFVVVQVESEAAFDLAAVPGLCDRRRGIGADGVLVVVPPRDPTAAARMRVHNADGSVPEMCGNGLRCVALLLSEQRHTEQVVIETDAGLRSCRVTRTANGVRVEADMGRVSLVGTRTLEVGGRKLELTLADAGNPHAIAYAVELEPDIDTLGPLVATHPSFERGTNFELVRWREGGLETVVWERGVGRTLACGTGACAVVAVACSRGEVKSGAPVRVRLPGGELVVTHDARSGRTSMEGPARRVFRGELSL